MGRATVLLSAVNPEFPADAVLLIKQLGTILAGWTKNPVSQDVLAVMAATTLGSVRTLVECLGGESPREVHVEAAACRFLVTCIDSNTALVLISRIDVTLERLRSETARLMRILAENPSETLADEARVMRGTESR